MKRIQLTSPVPVAAVAALLALAVLAGCASKSPLEKMVENRSRYSAELNGFYVEETPIVEEAPEGEAGTEEEPAVESAGDDEMEMPTDLDFGEARVDQKAHLDILVKHDSFEKLPGITVDITMVDAGRNEKGRWLLYLDTADVERANPTQYSHVIEDLDYVEGDAFSVEVRHPIPPEERGDYEEFEGLTE